jgi:hypothetical protein
VLRSYRKARCNCIVKTYVSFQREEDWRMGEVKGMAVKNKLETRRKWE